jgi:hypothetical protein
VDTKTAGHTAHYICQGCKEQLDVSWDFKDTPCPHSCQVCRKVKFCRLSSFRKMLCNCRCACRGCREVQKKR